VIAKEDEATIWRVERGFNGTGEGRRRREEVERRKRCAERKTSARGMRTTATSVFPCFVLALRILPGY